ncbi:probable myosin-binding protein 4 isoform X2 [Euphorbia lathyris]
MAASGILSVDSQKRCPSIKSALASAVLEWLLILLLFIDGIFAYLITKFACYCQLQTPCLLCSRLDRILGKYYWDLICKKHKSEISCLVLCHAHDKLVDVHGMCETCLFSFSTTNKSNAETYRLLVGKLREASGFGMDDGHTSSTRICSCCNSLWIPKGYSQNALQMSIIGSRAAYDQNNRTKVEEAGSFRSGHQKVTCGSNPLSHIRYKELKVNSDPESEIPFSDESDDAANIRSREISPTQNVGIRRVQMEPRVVMQPNDLAVEKLIDALTELQPPVSVSQSSESNGLRITSSKVALSNGLEEFRWEKVDSKHDSSAFPELISLDYVPPLSIPKETPIKASREIKHRSLEDGVPPLFDAKQTPAEGSNESVHIAVKDVPPSSVKSAERREHIPEDDVSEFEDANEALVEESTERKLKSVDAVPSSSVSGEAIAEALRRSNLISADDELPWSDGDEAIIRTSSKLISLVDVLPSSSGIETPVEGLKEKYIPRPEDIWQTVVEDSDEDCKIITTAGTITGTASETNPVSAENCQQVLNMLDLGDAYKLAISSRGRQLSGVLAEQWTGKDTSKISDDLKHLFSQFSNTREQSINDMSPRISLSPKYSVNSEELKNTDALTAVGMQMIQSRISPERFVLERNESGQSLDGSVVSEIDGETVVDRLTRQIEHDKKLLGGLYKELEEERSSSSIAVNQAMAMITRLQEEKATLQMEALQCVRMMEEQAEYDMEALQKTNDLLAAREKEIQDLEAELEYYRIKYPDEYLLEETMEPLFDMKTKIIKEENMEASTSTPKDSVTEEPATSSKVEENTVSMKSLLLDIEDERSYILRSLKELEKTLRRFPDYQLSMANNEYSGENEPEEDNSLSVDIAESNEMFYTPVVPNLDILANEVSDLNERLKALETDRSLIEHSINSVRDGEDGLKFVQEIASHLRELREIGIRREK